MATAPSIAVSARSFDDCGRVLPATDTEIRERNALALAAALDAVLEIGDEVEQRDTLDYLRRVVDEDRLSDRPRFAS